MNVSDAECFPRPVRDPIPLGTSGEAICDECGSAVAYRIWSASVNLECRKPECVAGGARG